MSSRACNWCVYIFLNLFAKYKLSKILLNATSERNGIVTNPKYEMYFVVQDIPAMQGATAFGITL